MGQHEGYLTPEVETKLFRVSKLCQTAISMKHRLRDFLQWLYIAAAVYLCSLFGYKQTVLLLYLRLFGVRRSFKYFTWSAMFFVFGYLFSNFWSQIFACSPPAKYWNPDIPGRCLDSLVEGRVYGLMNIVSDFFIMILPLPMIWNLQLSWKGKVGISLVFLGGVM